MQCLRLCAVIPPVSGWMDGEGWFVAWVVSAVGELYSIKLDAGLAFVVWLWFTFFLWLTD